MVGVFSYLTIEPDIGGPGLGTVKLIGSFLLVGFKACQFPEKVQVPPGTTKFTV